MTPTDALPVRYTSSADAGPVRATSAKSGNDQGQNGDAGFPNVLKKLSGDKDGSQQNHDHQRTKETAAAHGRRLDAARAALAEARGRQGDGADGEQPALDGEGEDALGTTEEPGDVRDEAQPQADGTVASRPNDALAVLMSLAHKEGQRNGKNGQKDDQGSAAIALQQADATTDGATVAQDVKIVSVKVETHFAAAKTDPATTGFAQRLAMTQITGSASGSKVSETQSVKLDAHAGREPGQDASAVDPTKEARGQFVAGRGMDRRGSDSAGLGAGKGHGEAKEDVGSMRADAVAAVASPSSDTSQAGVAGGVMQQVSGRILATAHELRAAASATPASPVADAASGVSAPVRVLSINLHPEELGSVTVRMSLVGDALEVQIEAELPDTAQMLKIDSDQLSDMLRTAGIQVDGLTVRAAAPDAVSNSSASGQSQFDQSQAQSGGAQSDSRASGGQRGEQDPQRSANFGSEDENRTQRAAGGGLYV